MLAFTVRRLLQAIPILLVASFVVFLLVSFSGDPSAELFQHQPPYPASYIADFRHRLRLDEPLLLRYWDWLTGVVQGDFGRSVQNIDIGHEIAKRLLVTSRLVLLAVVVAVVFAIIVGVFSAIRQYSRSDYAFTLLGFLFLSMPAFFFAILLKQYLAIDLNRRVGHEVLYTIGEQSIDPKHGLSHWTDVAGHIVLPTITLALISYAAWSRYQRASMLDVINSDYVRLARAKGLSRNRVLVRHMLRTALIPLTTVTAVDIGAIFGGAFITETIFQWHGMGDLLVGAISNVDTYMLLAWLLVSGIFVVVFNILADVLYAVLDPRIQHG